MEYIAFGIIAVAFLLFVFVQGVHAEKKERRWFMQKLKEQYGKAPVKEYKPERFLRIPGYYENHPQDGQIDDITWNDLGMDDIFKRVNYTLSSTGEEYLYYRLRTPEFDPEKLMHFHEIAEYFMENEQERISFQMLMRQLGSTGKFSLYDYITYLTNLGKRSNRQEYMMFFLMAVSVGIMFWNLTVGILMLLGGVIYQIFSYFKIRKEIEPYITSLAYMLRLNDVADNVQKLNFPCCKEEQQEIRKHIRNLNKSKRGSYFVFHDAKNGSADNPIDMILVYVTMIFHIDLIIFNRMLGEMIHKLEDIDKLTGLLGYLEAAVSVGLYRASMHGEVCIPEFSDDKLILEEGYHPLIQNPVKNSITADKSVLLTGSNASGKSTFLKMVALNVLLSQTIYTVCADRYKAPIYRLFTSMSLRDNLESGESYYIVEIKSIKRIMQEIDRRDQKIICFVDEVLRGTNTIERIAASSQILKSIADKGGLCFAATHDQELTVLLKEGYDNYHFEEEIVENDILFHYQLRPGKATTKNAIRLLQLMGYDNEMIECASEQALRFEETGVWTLS